MNNKAKIHFYPQGSAESGIFPGKNLSETRKKQSGTRYRDARRLKSGEIAVLEANRNTAEDWALVSVRDPFDPDLVRDCVFEGTVRIGCIEKGILTDNEKTYRCGISSSRIVSSDIGDYCAIHGNRLLSAIMTGNYVIISGNGEIFTTEFASFGNSMKKGGDAAASGQINLLNERGGRSAPVNSSMRGSDLWLYVMKRGDASFISRLDEFTKSSYDSENGYYSFFDDHTVITGTGFVRNTFTGRCCRIDGACRVDEVTIKSNAEYPVVIADNSIAVRGVAGEGCRIESSSIASDFVMAPSSTLRYGARFFHSYLGSCSNISCCEVLSSFIYPCHEQHHNSSFLIASLVMGQSNIAAGATLGSNHNGRMNDCEMHAGRGFWPGLCSSVRFNSRFASFCLLAKSDFPYEIDIKLPFSLISNNSGENCLEIIPAYWWLYNMYALFRNYFKFRNRTAMVKAMDGIELDFMAPDTAEEVIRALSFIGEARKKASGIETEFRSINIELKASGIESSDRSVRLLRVDKAERAYREMLLFYSGSMVFSFINEAKGNLDLLLRGSFSQEREKAWVNVCGTLVPGIFISELIKDTLDPVNGISSWQDIHERFDSENELYRVKKLSHAVSVALMLYDTEKPDIAFLEKLRADYLEILYSAEREIRRTRKKDYDDPVRQAMFSGKEEMEAVLGRPEGDPLPVRFRKHFIDTVPVLT